MRNFNTAKQIERIITLKCVTKLTDSQHTKMIKSMVSKTWRYQARSGIDSRNLKHRGIKVRHVLKVDNKRLLAKYKKEQDKSHHTHDLPQKLQDEPILTKEVLNASDDDQTETEPLLMNILQPGESYLFHGTKLENIPHIVTGGFDLGRAMRGLYGRALYLAESSEKADQYAGIHLMIID